MSLRPLLTLTLGLLLTVALAACGSDDSSDSGSGDSGSETVSLEDCTPDQLDTLDPDTLTVATDSPAYPPYFEDDDPTNGKGFESAVAYAIADQLGYSNDQVEWVVEPFNSSYAPGPKDFDFDVNQISITDKRAEQVDFSTPYYTANQAVVALKDSDVAGASSISDLAGARIGVQIGTTSLEAVESVVQPDEDPQIYDTSNDVVSALKNGSVEAVVVDVPTAFYLTSVQVPEAAVVGQFEAPGGDQFGALLAKDSSLTPCVSAAIEELDSSGELGEIENKWLSEATDAPVLQ